MYNFVKTNFVKINNYLHVIPAALCTCKIIHITLMFIIYGTCCVPGAAPSQNLVTWLYFIDYIYYVLETSRYYCEVTVSVGNRVEAIVKVVWKLLWKSCGRYCESRVEDIVKVVWKILWKSCGRYWKAICESRVEAIVLWKSCGRYCESRVEAIVKVVWKLLWKSCGSYWKLLWKSCGSYCVLGYWKQ